MAYTSVIPVRRLDRAVKYVMNKEKTTAVSLQDALDYAANRDKTEQSCFESSYACTLETAFADMRQTKERWHKLGGVQGYHLVQSFAAGEVTPELAHRIAKELADRVLGGRYEYVIGCGPRGRLRDRGGYCHLLGRERPGGGHPDAG